MLSNTLYLCHFPDISESTYGESLKSAPFQFDNNTCS